MRARPVTPFRVAVRMMAFMMIVALSGCAAMRPKPVPPTVTVDTVRFVVAPTGETRVRVSLDVTNPNAYDIAIRSIDATFRVEDIAIATASLPNPATLPASGRTFVEMEARPDFAAMRQVLDRVMRKLGASYEFTGRAVVQDGLSLPFTKRGDVPLAELMGRVR